MVSATVGTPPAYIDRLNIALRKAADLPSYKEAMQKDGLMIAVNSPLEMAAFMKDEVERWRKVVNSQNIKTD